MPTSLVALALLAFAAPAQTPAPLGPQAASLSPETRADILMARKMYREAAETYLSIKPPTAVSLNKTGIAYHQIGDLESALKLYQRSIKLDKTYSEAINNLGTVFYARKNYRRAISQYQKALKYSPLSASIQSNLGTAYFARKDYKRATECYEKALSLDPDVFEHRSAQGVLLQERSVEERARFHYELAKMYAKSGRTELALLYIRKSLEEGFKDRKKYTEEKEFAALQELPEFIQLMALEPRVL
jgi:tetratricopeptide (TPR) repeat protein